MKQLDNETKEIIDSFVAEGYDLLEDNDTQTTEIDSEKPLSDEAVEDVPQICGEELKNCDSPIQINLEILPGHESFDITEKNLKTQIPDEFIHESILLLSQCEKAISLLQKNINQPIYLKKLLIHVQTLKHTANLFQQTEIEREALLMETVLEEVIHNQREFSPNMIQVISDHLTFITALIKKTNLCSSELNSSKTSEIFSYPYFSKQKNPDFAKKYKQIGEILIEMGATTQEKLEKALDEQNRPLGQILLDKEEITADKLEKALKIQKKSADESMMDLQFGRNEIRVNTAKLDKLFDLVGELIIAQTLVFNSIEADENNEINFNKDYNAMNKITRELQEITMMVRMIPLDGLFNKMNRLVRDLSKKSDKKINFTISGQETEMDKNVIEQISDPLIHIIRNAVDHGIENNEARIAAGKNEEGAIFLSAKYEGNEIWVSIKDDGKGLSREKIVQKAIEQGLTTESASRQMSDKEAWQFIFEPGFSTAEQITDISGRGVGMDVVKKNLEKIRGKIDIKTTLSQGSEFILKIPLTMAIIDAITVKTGDLYFSIPLLDILEFFKVDNVQITETAEGTNVLKLRDQLLTIINLHEIFKIKNAKKDFKDGIMLVAQSDHRKACLFIDEIIGAQQIVIKALPEQMGKIEGLSGCSVMGNGGVSFIVDTGGLFTKWLY